MKDSFADVLKDMRSLVGNAPPDGRITVDTLEHFYQRLDGVAKNTSDALDWYEYMAKQMQRATLQVDSQVMLGLMKELAPKTITEVTSRLEEMFDAKGNETGSKMVKQTITIGAE